MWKKPVTRLVEVYEFFKGPPELNGYKRDDESMCVSVVLVKRWRQRRPGHSVTQTNLCAEASDDCFQKQLVLDSDLSSSGLDY